MKLRRFLTLAAALLSMMLPSAVANAQMGGCCTDCCCGGEFFGEIEFHFTKYYQSGHGVRNSGAPDNDDSADFDYSLAPRFIVGYQRCDGLGARINYWIYDDDAPTNDAGFVSIEAQTLDFEFFQTVDMCQNTTLEFFGGARFAQFEQQDDTDLDYGYDSYGLTGGMELSRYLRVGGRLYARGRLSLLNDSGYLLDSGNLDEDDDSRFHDQIFMQTELAIGWEGRRCMGYGDLVYGVGAEYQLWTDSAIGGDESTEANFYDSAWGGVLFNVGLVR